MEHIRQFDWFSSQVDKHFLDELSMDSSTTELILRNKFRDPLISSDSEDDGNPEQKIDWNEVFKQRPDERQHRQFIPALRPVPQYPKLSALTAAQHFHMLKVLSDRFPNVLESYYMQKPYKKDLRIFEQMKETYEKEQQEYIEWAKTLWTTSQCIRALRPKPAVETVYEAEFLMRATELQAFPKRFSMAAQIPLDVEGETFEMVFEKDLKRVIATKLPQIDWPDLQRKFSIVRPCSVPEPCTKHPCRFILPNEDSMSILPLTEIHRELAQYALDNGAQCVASERALKCLLETDSSWVIPLSVCQVIGADSEMGNVIVMGTDFSINRECAQTRTYKAYRHLLELALTPPNGKAARMSFESNESRQELKGMVAVNLESMESNVVSSDDDDDDLVIDTDNLPLIDLVPLAKVRSDSDNSLHMEVDAPGSRNRKSTENGTNGKSRRSSATSENGKCTKGKHRNSSESSENYNILAGGTNRKSSENSENSTCSDAKNRKSSESSVDSKLTDGNRRFSETSENGKRRKSAETSENGKRANGKMRNSSENGRDESLTNGKVGNCTEKTKKDEYYSCSCADSLYATPAPRSFRKWQIRDNSTTQSYNIVVHCSHKVRGNSGEIILEPTPEYQIDMGASKQSEHKIRSLALSLMLRRNASLLNVRVDGPTGDIVTLDHVFLKEFLQRHGDVRPRVARAAFTALDQLQGLLPGCYVLRHEPSHGSNALLFAPNGAGVSTLALSFDCTRLAEADEAKSVKTPPTLTPALLPYHKFRRTLPCAFTPYENQVAKETKKPVVRQRTPPQAIKWPKRRLQNKRNVNRR